MLYQCLINYELILTAIGGAVRLLDLKNLDLKQTTDMTVRTTG